MFTLCSVSFLDPSHGFNRGTQGSFWQDSCVTSMSHVPHLSPQLNITRFLRNVSVPWNRNRWAWRTNSLTLDITEFLTSLCVCEYDDYWLFLRDRSFPQQYVLAPAKILSTVCLTDAYRTGTINFRIQELGSSVCENHLILVSFFMVFVCSFKLILSYGHKIDHDWFFEITLVLPFF
jgi:hypothetical protein